MTNDHIREKIAEVLESETSLRIFWTESPQVMLMPYMRSREKLFASISLLVIPSVLNLETLSFVLTHVISLLGKSPWLVGLYGIELRVFVREGNDASRIMRLSVRSEDLHKAAALGAIDLLNPNPIDGVNSVWYVSPPAN